MIKKVVKKIVAALAVIFLLLALFFSFVYIGVFGHILTKSELREFTNETATVVTSGNGTLLGRFFSKNRTNVKYFEFPSHLIHALVATEDSRFFEHGGIDSKSLFIDPF